MEEFRSLKHKFLLIIISVQIIGIVLILAFWILIRHKKRRTSNTSQLATADEKFSSLTETDDSIMTSPQDPNDRILLNLGSHGYIHGLLIRDNATPLAQYFGGVRYALPPSQRWAMARRLPAEYSYGTQTNPGKCDGQAVTCPQPFMADQGSEDCFECNVWMPVRERPDGGTYALYVTFVVFMI